MIYVEFINTIIIAIGWLMVYYLWVITDNWFFMMDDVIMMVISDDWWLMSSWVMIRSWNMSH